MKIGLNHTTVMDDHSLMSGILQGLPESLEHLYQQYHDALKSVVMRVLHNDAEADDVLQEVFLQVWKGAHTYSAEKGKLISWLCTLAKRRAIDHVRQFTAYRRATDRYEVFCGQSSKEAEDFSPVEYEVGHDELRKFLQVHLQTLPPSQKLVVSMAYFEERTQREISALTDTPLGTVKTRLELGMKKLALSVKGLRADVL